MTKMRRKNYSMLLKKQIRAYGGLLKEVIKYMSKEVELPSLKLPEFDVTTNEDIELASEKCRREWGLTMSSPINSVTRVLENNGIVVVEFKGLSGEMDSCSYVGRIPIVVRSNSKQSNFKLRFDLAYELGRLVLHQGIEDYGDKEEKEASRFARAFLLPRTRFSEEFPKPRNKYFNWQSLLEFKLRWGVSIQTIIKRAYELELIDVTQYHSFFIYINKKGWKKEEPKDKETPLEKSELLQACFDLLYSVGISPRFIADSLELQVDYIKRFGVEIPQKENNIIRLRPKN